MTEIDKLKASMRNLKANGSKSITLDIDWLLTLLNNVDTEIKQEKQHNKANKLSVDGGTF